MRVVLIALALLLTLSGCMEIREVVQVKPDGSVLYTLDLAMPEFMLALGEIAGESAVPSPTPPWFASQESDSVRTREFVDEDMHHYVAERTLQSLAHLVAVGADTAQSGNAGVLPGFKTETMPGGSIRIRRRFDAESMERGVPMDAMEQIPNAPRGAELGRAQKRFFAGRYYRLTIQAPRIVSSNGTAGSGGTSTEWKVPMATAMAESAPEYVAVISLKK